MFEKTIKRKKSNHFLAKFYFYYEEILSHLTDSHGYIVRRNNIENVSHTYHSKYS